MQNLPLPLVVINHDQHSERLPRCQGRLAHLGWPGGQALDAGAAFAVLVKIDEDQGQCLLLHGLPMNRRRES